MSTHHHTHHKTHAKSKHETVRPKHAAHSRHVEAHAAASEPLTTKPIELPASSENEPAMPDAPASQPESEPPPAPTQTATTSSYPPMVVGAARTIFIP